MKTIKVIFVITLVHIAVCHARLGEDAKQLEARYGKPLSQTDGATIIEPCKETWIYEKNGLGILVGFWRGVSAYEIFFKKTDDTFSQAEIDALLSANSGKSEWEKSKEISMNDRYFRKDGKAMAEVSSLSKNVSIFDTEFQRESDRLTAEKQKKNLEGF